MAAMSVIRVEGGPDRRFYQGYGQDPTAFARNSLANTDTVRAPLGKGAAIRHYKSVSDDQEAVGYRTSLHRDKVIETRINIRDIKSHRSFVRSLKPMAPYSRGGRDDRSRKSHQ